MEVTASELNLQAGTATADPNPSPLVSIVINNYNYGQFLTQAIDSSLNQTYANIEVVVVDDGSADSSATIIQSYGDRIIAILKENGGQASAMNAGFAASKGDIICLLDSDDLFLPKKVEAVVKKFQAHPNIDWVFTESAPVESGSITTTGLSDLFDTISRKSATEELDEINFKARILNGRSPNFTPSTSNLCFSRQLLEKIFPLPEIKGVSGMAITDLYIKSLAVGLATGCVTKRDLGIYRFHNNYYKTLNRDKKRRMFGEIYTTTGYWIKQKFPEFGKFSRKTLAKGYAAYSGSSYLKQVVCDADCQSMFIDYLERSSYLEILEIYLMMLYYLLKFRFKSFA